MIKAATAATALVPLFLVCIPSLYTVVCLFVYNFCILCLYAMFVYNVVCLYTIFVYYVCVLLFACIQCLYTMFVYYVVCLYTMFVYYVCILCCLLVYNVGIL